jgi:UDP-N-acetylglucosamine--N-acetylmuramyl-(pentapeptide) pyrophosphoryl-undecaprenol N-acetylglucosamine transferase
VGSHGPEKELVVKAGYTFREIKAGKLRRYGKSWWRDPEQLWANLKDLVRIKVGILQSLWIIWRFKPEVVLAKGGYVAFPVGVAAWLLRVPLVVHETDLVMGLANRILSKIATRIAVPHDNGLNPKLVTTGNPVRPELFKPMEHTFFDVDEKLPVVLVTGGSQGAAPINHLVFAALPELLGFSYVIHITGGRSSKEAEEVAQALPAKLRGRYFHAAFLVDEYIAALQQASVVVTRSGGSIFEIAALHKPMILIPLPHAAGDHQTVNARWVEGEGAGIMLPQGELTAQKLGAVIHDLLLNKGRLEQMAKSSETIEVPDAAERLAELVRSSARRHA